MKTIYILFLDIKEVVDRFQDFIPNLVQHEVHIHDTVSFLCIEMFSSFFSKLFFCQFHNILDKAFLNG